MATANKQTVKTPVVTTTYVSKETVTLTLSMAEAETLRVVTALIGGVPETTRRCHMDSIKEALQGAGVEWLYRANPSISLSCNHPRAASYSGSITFTPESF